MGERERFKGFQMLRKFNMFNRFNEFNGFNELHGGNIVKLIEPFELIELMKTLPDRLPYPDQPLEQSLHLVKRQHIGSVAFGFGRVGVGFNEEAVGSGGDGC